MRVVGIETEYGVVDRADPGANPILVSSELIQAYREASPTPTALWDYGAEDPLQDLRGHRMDRAAAHPTQLTDEPGYDPDQGIVLRRRRRGSGEDPAHLNAVLSNGARFYVDHAHPEYSGPEVTTALDAVRWDRAGDIVALRAATRLAQTTRDVALYKNNVDGKGASYGTHENFLVDRDVPFEDLARRITAHLVTRQVFTGAGRVGRGQRGEEPGFQLSQRADYIEAEVGLETTLRRPIVNTRDEPHCDRRRWRRLHVIIGDANCMDVPTYLKVGTTALVLSAIEAGDERLDALVLADPVESVQHVSRDIGLRAPLELKSGEGATALEVQRALIEICRDYVADADAAQVLARWEDVVDRLGREPMTLTREVEWVAKLDLLGRMRARYGATHALAPWDDHRLAAADIQWSDIDPARGLAAKLRAAGAVEVLVDDAEAERCADEPPANTRAALRGAAVLGGRWLVDSAGWSTVVLDNQGSELEVAVLDDPLQTDHPLLGEVLARAADAREGRG